MRLHISKLEDTDVLSGAIGGRRFLSRLLERIEDEPSTPTPLFLDFSGIDVATASYLRESILSFRDIVRTRRSNYYPIVANASQTIIEELDMLLRHIGTAMPLCKLDGAAHVSDFRVLGVLDDKQQQTYNLVVCYGTTSAADLARRHGESEGIGQTAWNNRLASLSALGIVAEQAHGRRKLYRPILGEV